MSIVFTLMLRVVSTYLLVLILMRLSGKRSIGEITPFDLIIAIILGDLPGNVLAGEVPLEQGAIAALTIVLAHSILSAAAFRFAWIDRLVNSTPALFIRDGKFIEQNVARERVCHTEIDAMLRERGIIEKESVREAYLEPSGFLSVHRRRKSQPAPKRELEEQARGS